MIKCINCRKKADIVFGGVSFCWDCGDEHIDFLKKIKNMSIEEIEEARKKAK